MGSATQLEEDDNDIHEQEHDTTTNNNKNRNDKNVSKSNYHSSSFIAQQSYKKSQLALLTLQNLTRSIIATNFVQIVRRNYNATLIQKVHRKWVAQKIYVVTLYICSWLQKSQRGNVGRVRFESLNKERKSIILQNIWRSYYLKKLHHLKKKIFPHSSMCYPLLFCKNCNQRSESWCERSSSNCRRERQSSR